MHRFQYVRNDQRALLNCQGAGQIHQGDVDFGQTLATSRTIRGTRPILLRVPLPRNYRWLGGTLDSDASARSQNLSDRQPYNTSQSGWQDTVDLLRLLQGDYEGARRQLQKVSQTLSESQSVLNERIQYALFRAAGHDTMCLFPYRVGAAASSLGRATLGSPVSLKHVPLRARLDVRCLGTFELSWAGKPVAKWGSTKAKALIEYMMARPREPVIKDALMEALWPNCDPQSANNNLKAAVHALRQTLAAAAGSADTALIVFVQGSYVLNREIEMWVDVEEFEKHWAAGRQFEREGRTHDAIREFKLAETLYRGDYLQDEPYEEWTILQREALRDNYLAILGKLAEHALQEDDYEDAIAYAQKILAHDSCREDAFRWMMRSHSRLGQRSRAIRWFELCRRATRAGLDTEPDRETQDLYRLLLNNEPI